MLDSKASLLTGVLYIPGTWSGLLLITEEGGKSIFNAVSEPELTFNLYYLKRNSSEKVFLYPHTRINTYI